MVDERKIVHRAWLMKEKIFISMNEKPFWFESIFCYYCACLGPDFSWVF